MERDAFHINVSLGWGSAVLAAGLWRRSAAPAVFVLWFEAGNALMHGAMAVRERRYNPGLITALGLMGVHAVAGGRALRRSRRLAARETFVGAAGGIAAAASMPLAMKLRMRSAA